MLEIITPYRSISVNKGLYKSYQNKEHCLQFLKLHVAVVKLFCTTLQFKMASKKADINHQFSKIMICLKVILTIIEIILHNFSLLLDNIMFFKLIMHIDCYMVNVRVMSRSHSKKKVKKIIFLHLSPLYILINLDKKQVHDCTVHACYYNGVQGNTF